MHPVISGLMRLGLVGKAMQLAAGLTDDLEVDGVKTHVGGMHIETHQLAGTQAAVAIHLDVAEVHEDVVAPGVGADEAVTLGIVEPLDGPGRHVDASGCFAHLLLLFTPCPMTDLSGEPQHDEVMVRQVNAGRPEIVALHAPKAWVDAHLPALSLCYSQVMKIEFSAVPLPALPALCQAAFPTMPRAAGPDRQDDLPDADAHHLAVVDEIEPSLKPPRRYQVVILNDDYTPMEFVIDVLQQFFSLSEEQATRLMLQVHHQGRAGVGNYSRDVAETKAALVVEYARQHEHPLLCQAEPMS